jgi:Flp pilus assembly protein TadG
VTRVGAIRARLARFAGDRRGVSALEFALIAPVMILIFFGVGELSSAMMAQRRIGHVASTIGDLVSQTSSLADSDISDIFSVSSTIMQPFATTGMTMRVTSMTGDSHGNAQVDWSLVQNTTARCSASGLPTGMITQAGDSVIVAEATYTYNSPVQYVLPNALNFSKVFYLRPRKSAQVAYTGSNPGC